MRLPLGPTSGLAADWARSSETLVHEALATLNRDFDQVLGDLQGLEAMRVFPLQWQRKMFKAWRTTLEETRAWANFEVIEVLHEREEREWARFGLIRRPLRECI